MVDQGISSQCKAEYVSWAGKRGSTTEVPDRYFINSR
jgi:hypothetical protein